MGKYDDRLADYVDVKERVRLFYEAHPSGRLVTHRVKVTDEPDGVPRVWVQARAYRDPDDPLPGRGWSWMTLPGGTPYTRGSELENTETSAWGRAIGALGIGIAHSIATKDEAAAKAGADQAGDPGDGSLTGIAETTAKQTSDGELRYSPDGALIGFRLRSGRGGIGVEAHGPLAEQIAEHRDRIIGQRITVWGKIDDRQFTPAGKIVPVRFQVLVAERLRAPEVGDLPVETAPTSELTEAESTAIWETIDA